MILFLLFLGSAGIAQEKYFSRNGEISFFSKAPIEDIEAHHNQVSSILNVQTGEMVFSMFIKGFQFEKSLMQEHFNENYLESDKFPKATFKGEIQNFSDLNLADKDMVEFTVKGEMDIHGVVKEYSIPGKLVKTESGFQGTAKFKIRVEDHKIKIPSMVIDNIAEVVDVNVKISYKPYNK